MFTTTYRHDFIPPVTKRYNFIKNHEGEKSQSPDCNVQPGVQPPASVLAQCAAAEWTGIAPMGRLVEPRIIPTKFEEVTDDKVEACRHDQPNKFLKILRTCYPDLYERLKSMPQDELSRRLDIYRLMTTYQIDFCNVNEYPEGVYESLDSKDKKPLSVGMLQEEDACKRFKGELSAELHSLPDNFTSDQCQRAYKPVKYSFADSSRFTNVANYSHWAAPPGTRKTTFSEYMDSISKTGCVIIKNNIHSHTKCQNGKNCRHKLRHTCPQLL